MPEGPDGKTIIIVKKVSGHGGHHGGAWKVAYADFVTAMMALFLVLWLVSQSSVTTREAIASYFKRPGVFEEGSGTPLEIGGGGIMSDTFAPPAEGNVQTIPSKKIYTVESEGGPRAEGFPGGAEETPTGAEGGGRLRAQEIEFERVATELEETLKSSGSEGAGGSAGAGGKGRGGAAATLGEVTIKVDQRGLHLEIMDTPTASMFQSGSAEITGEAEQELLRIAERLQTLPNPIDIEGHTDAVPYREGTAKRYDNWDLSTDRANTARRILQRVGIEDWQIARVVGYASQRPKKLEDALDASNRRITISMRYTDLAASALTPVGAQEAVSQPFKAPGSSPETPPTEAPNSALPQNGETDSDVRKAFEQTISKSGTEGGFSVEVSTSLPEGATIEQSESESNRPLWVDKDKIFGDRNPFFSR